MLVVVVVAVGRRPPTCLVNGSFFLQIFRDNTGGLRFIFSLLGLGASGAFRLGALCLSLGDAAFLGRSSLCLGAFSFQSFSFETGCPFGGESFGPQTLGFIGCVPCGGFASFGLGELLRPFFRRSYVFRFDALGFQMLRFESLRLPPVCF